jgi:hypothetical protein
MIKYLLLASFFLLFVCNYSFAQQRIPKDTVITLERDPGFWGWAGQPPADCPFYKLTIFANGNVELEPKNIKENKIVTGKTIKSRVSKKQLKQLVSKFEKIDFYSLNSISEKGGGNRGDCPQYGTDDVTAITTINFKGKKNRVEHYYGCRGTEVLLKLTNLENEIDEAVNIKQWFDCYGGRNRINLPIQTN